MKERLGSTGDSRLLMLASNPVGYTPHLKTDYLLDGTATAGAWVRAFTGIGTARRPVEPALPDS